jgi:hypothetical protein
MRTEIHVPWRAFFGAVLALFAASAVAGEITLYQSRDFRGDSLTLRRAAPDLERTGFNDTASSVIVRDGVWEACEGTLNDRVSSVREIVGVSSAPPPVLATAPPPVVASADPRIVLFQQPGFAGAAVELRETNGKLDRINTYAGADAVIVYGGTWRLCTRDYYRGECADFGPGRYDSLGALNGRISSAELVAAAPAQVGVVTPLPPAEGRVVLYDLPDFAGSSLVIDRRELPNLEWRGFMDRAASMRIESGTWMFCTDTRFQGACRTYGPGEYPRLSRDVDRKIASVRRVDEVYGAASPAQQYAIPYLK